MAALIHLTGYRLLEAVHLVVTAGDVRLGTLLAQGGGRAVGHALLDHQLQVRANPIEATLAADPLLTPS